MADTVGTLKANIVANASGFSAGMNQAASSATGASTKIRAALLGIQSVGSQLGGIVPEALLSGLSTAMNPTSLTAMGVIGGLAAAWRTAQTYAREAKQTFQDASRTGLGVVAYQELAIAARKSGVEIGTAEAAVNRMRKAIAEGANGNRTDKAVGPGAIALAELGLNARQLETMGPEKSIGKIADSLGQVQNAYQRARIEQALFGESGAQLEPLLRRLQNNGLDKLKGKVLAPEELQALRELETTFGKDIPMRIKKATAQGVLTVEDTGADLKAGRVDAAMKRSGVDGTVLAQASTGNFSGAFASWVMNKAMGSKSDAPEGEATIEARRLANEEEARNAAASRAAISAADDRASHRLGGFGEMAQAGSQAAYQASTAWQYGLEDKAARQLEVLEDIRGLLANKQQGSGEAEPVG
jgi:hypothetical protein